jgi:chloramphenicol-sensitive protein RarD
MNQHDVGRGIALSVFASSLFALMSAYTTLLAPLDGLEIFGWRILWTVPGALALVAWRGRWPVMRALAARLWREPRLTACLCLLSAMLGVQLWIFLWAPLHGRTLDVSLGYFLLPLVMVLLGRFYYGEPLDGWQWAGLACASVAVAHEFFTTRAFSWPTMVVAFGYPPYFMLRKKLNLDPLVSFAAEICLIAPVALAMLAVRHSFDVVAHRPGLGLVLLLVLLPGLGLLSTAALGAYLRASRYLPMALFGILGYVEPILLVAVAIAVLKEPFSAQQLGTYGPIAASVALTAVHSARAWRDERRRVSRGVDSVALMRVAAEPRLDGVTQRTAQAESEQ